MQRPRRALFKTTLNSEGAFVRLIGNFDVNAGGRFGQDKRFANLKILDHERSPFEKLRAGLEHQIDESRCRKDDKVLDLMVLKKCHVTAVEPGTPCRRRARQPHIEQATAASSQAA